MKKLPGTLGPAATKTLLFQRRAEAAGCSSRKWMFFTQLSFGAGKLLCPRLFWVVSSCAPEHNRTFEITYASN